MDIGVLGTGMVGRTLSGRLAELGHDVVVGTRDPATTSARTEPDRTGNPPFATWHAEHPEVGLVSLPQAAGHGEVLVNATAGVASLAALTAADVGSRDGLLLLDVANALDFSAGFPPPLAVANTDSLAEQIQRAFPNARVVKSLNTMNARVMVDPAGLSSAHDVFVAGDDAAAKQTVVDLLHQLGWADTDIVDLGGLRAARGLEMYLPLWLALVQAMGTTDINIKVVRA